jgi:hypothetical protein
VTVGAAPVIPEGAHLLARTPGSQALRLDFMLRPRDPAQLQSLALAVSTPGSAEHGRFLTVRQFAARFGQTRPALQAAESALRRIGLVPGQATANGLLIPVVTTVGRAAAALHTGFGDYRLASGRVAYANTTAARLPATLAAMTTAVVGLNNLAAPVISPPLRHAHTSRPQPRRVALSTVGPAACPAATQAAQQYHGWTYPQLASAYSLNPLYNDDDFGLGIKIALFELDPWSASDISSFQACYGTNTSVTQVNVDGGPGAGPGGGEAALDIETAIALAPQASIRVYDAPIPTGSTQQQFVSSYATSAADELTKIFDDGWASELSISYGICESVLQADDPGFMQSENTLFAQAATEGISVFAASGDTGSEGCSRAGGGDTTLSVSDPAGQPFVTSVGGTTLTATGPPPAETVWNEGDGFGTYFQNGAGGGGISRVWPMPSWQTGPGVINSYSSGIPCGKAGGYCREVPDVSANADWQASPYIIYYTGPSGFPNPWVPNGGTSAATPLWAAMIADISSRDFGFRRLGFLNPFLYQTAASGFNDITSGNNDWSSSNGGDYPATPGYDLATGRGTPIASALASALHIPNLLILHHYVICVPGPFCGRYSPMMIGDNPEVKAADPFTNINTDLIPLVMKFPNGDTWNPAQTDSCDSGASALTRTQNSPVFKAQNWTWGGTSIGTGQYTDAFQRAEFWKYANPKGIDPKFGINLVLKTLKTVTIKVPTADGATGSITCGNGLLGAVNINWLDPYLQKTVIPSLKSQGVSPGTLPVFLLHNVVEYAGTSSQCCVLGYHNAYTTSSGIQTYALADYDNSGAFTGSSDITALSAEVADWVNDPLTINSTPPWGHTGHVTGCQSNLEVSNPLTGTNFTDKADSFTYHPQELAFFSWFYHQKPSLGVNGWYSNHGTFKTPAAPCTAQTAHGKISARYPGADISNTTPPLTANPSKTQQTTHTATNIR